MKKLTRLRGLALVGAASLFLSLAGSAYAIPFQTDTMADSNANSQCSVFSRADYSAVFPFYQINTNAWRAGPATAFDYRPVPGTNPFWNRYFPRQTPTTGPVVAATVASALVVRVPDGGATIMLFAGGLLGLFILGRKWTA